MSLEGWVLVVMRGANLLRAARANSLPLFMPASSMSFINSGMMRSITIAYVLHKYSKIFSEIS